MSFPFILGKNSFIQKQISQDTNETNTRNLTKVESSPLMRWNNIQKMNIADQKVQVAEEIKRDIWKYLESFDVADDTWYNYACHISSCAK